MNFKNMYFITGADSFNNNYYCFLLGGETAPISEAEYNIIKDNKCVYNTETKEVIVYE